MTLFIMLIVALIFVPIILFYTSWAYAVMRGKVTAAYIKENSHSTY
jgi:cytochrome d ubiquinol oxidase subunit II